MHERTQSFYFLLAERQTAQPLVLFKCFSTAGNADGAECGTAAAELVIRKMFWSKQPPGLSAGSPKCCILGRYGTPLLAPPTAANAELHWRGARQAAALSALEGVRCGGTAGFFLCFVICLKVNGNTNRNMTFTTRTFF